MKTKQVFKNGFQVGLVTNNSKKSIFIVQRRFLPKNKEKILFFFAMKSPQQQLSS